MRRLRRDLALLLRDDGALLRGILLLLLELLRLHQRLRVHHDARGRGPASPRGHRLLSGEAAPAPHHLHPAAARDHVPLHAAPEDGSDGGAAAPHHGHHAAPSLGRGDHPLARRLPHHGPAPRHHAASHARGSAPPLLHHLAAASHHHGAWLAQ